MDRASGVLAEGILGGMPKTYAALAAHSDVPLSTLHHCARGRRWRGAKAETQQYLTPCKENAVVDYLIHKNALEGNVRMKHITSLVFSATSHRSNMHSYNAC
jgi:hypothetical protein